MVGGGGGLRGGEGCGHRPLTGGVGGRRTANYAGFGYVRGHPGDGLCSNPPTYQTTRQLGHDLQPMRVTQYRTTRSHYASQPGGFLERSRSLPTVGKMAAGGKTPGLSYAETQAMRITAPMTHISPW